MASWQPMLVKIGKMTFIRQADWKMIVPIQKYFNYTLCNLDEDRSSNPID